VNREATLMLPKAMRLVVQWRVQTRRKADGGL
jgi:hypothetical protein